MKNYLLLALIVLISSLTDYFIANAYVKTSVAVILISVLFAVFFKHKIKISHMVLFTAIALLTSNLMIFLFNRNSINF